MRNLPDRVEPITVRFDDVTMRVGLIDGRGLRVPMAWFPCHFHASPEQRADIELIAILSSVVMPLMRLSQQLAS